ncbi:hypothetical protein GACE_0412 [Geoglobus acetivorans]|uniref:Uncharacterized protein n=2 Tax=Geoglobus acetivorans TaxID=565033 RepID=A0A0A7GBP0_GEOAI|nr:hypothetical protein GACE_0412 [Geoglobus acetivorans]
MYGYTFLMWAIEAMTGLNHVWIGPVLAPTIYAGVIETMIMPPLVAFIYFYLAERSEKARGGG